MPTRTHISSGPFVPGVGAVFSVDIAVPEHQREVRFYSRVLSTGENPLWREEPALGNLAESFRRAQEEGGRVIKAMQGEDGEDMYAAVQVPGAYLGLIAG
jgi:hypothetical protein